MTVPLGESPRGDNPLSAQLEKHVGDMQANAASYPEMQRVFTEQEANELEAVKTVLLDLPLVHSTSRTEEDMRGRGVLTHALRPAEYYGHSNKLDESLGLTEYVFMYWGSAEKSSYGKNHVLIDTKLLFDSRTVVTPNDIAASCFGIDKPVDSLTQTDRAHIQEAYLDKMVTGKDWFEIISRRIMRKVSKGREPFRLTSQMILGEVKYHGILDPAYITGYLTPFDEEDYWKGLINRGFIPGPVGRAYPQVGNDYDKTAEQLGTTLQAGREFWHKVFVGTDN